MPRENSGSIAGPAGQLETSLRLADPDCGRFAVLCHPHPQFGGTMHDAILDITERALLATGSHCLRFNFRGVGASEGVHDGQAEADDVAAVAAWVLAEHAPEGLILVGYSFGAAMAWRALGRIATPTRVLLIAPPVGSMALPARSPGCPIDVVAGDMDQFVDSGTLAAWQGVNAHILTGADHFFSGQWQELEARLGEILQNA
jgi:alpha/beta superfamily hydrolase